MPSVIFVCRANRFRSPLAAGIFKKALQEEENNPTPSWTIGDARSWRVGSAGTWTAPGQPALPEVYEAAKKLGVDLSNHRSIQVNEQLLLKYDLIVVMQNSQKEALQSEFPHLNEHIYLLSHVVESGSYDIPDSIGSQQEITEISAELNELIRSGLRYICVLATYLHNTRYGSALQDG
jgi:protein-tyrosine phosphatase